MATTVLGPVYYKGQPLHGNRAFLDTHITPKIKLCPEHGCWLWTRGVTPSSGYGRIHLHQGPGLGKRCITAHRASFEYHYGPPPAGLLIRHRCHQKTCINPDHLHLGTPSENAADTASTTEAIAHAKKHARYSDDQIRHIRQLYADGLRFSDIARIFHDDDTARVRHICLGISYKWVDYTPEKPLFSHEPTPIPQLPPTQLHLDL